MIDMFCLPTVSSATGHL